MMNELLPIKPPEFNRPVRAVIKHNNWVTVVKNLYTVDEDDVLWRTCDDDSELSYMVDVIYWEYLDDIT